jgi:molecular chaperone DnaK
MTSFGIDFGTTNSVLSSSEAGGATETLRLDDPPEAEWAKYGFDLVLPTVISEHGDHLDFGWRAKRSPDHLAAVKRLFATDDEVTVGTRTMRVEEAAGIFFRHIKHMASESGRTLDRAVVTIPANSRGVARFRTKVSAGLSGIEVLALLNEPTAAAMAYGRHIGDGERVLVFDWGGGTLDVTILRNLGGVFIEEASKGVQRLGGIDVDSAFETSLRPYVPAGSWLDRGDLELAKVRLSSQESTSLNLPGGNIELTRREFEDAIRPLAERTIEPVQRCLADLGQPRIDHLVLVGGSSKIPLVRRLVQDAVRLDPMEGVDPMTAVAEGAALAAGILLGEVTEFDFFVGTEHALGTVVVDDRDQETFSTLIPRNTKLPASATEGFLPKYDFQESVLIEVIEGDPELPIDHEDNVILKRWEIPLEPKPKDDAGFAITYEYDVDGILHVRAVGHATGGLMMDEELTFGAAGSKQELVEIRRRIDAVRTVSTNGNGAGHADVPLEATIRNLSEESRAAVRKAKAKIHPYVDEEVQRTIDEQIEALQASSADEEDSAREALERTIREHAYLL